MVFVTSTKCKVYVIYDVLDAKSQTHIFFYQINGGIKIYLHFIIWWSRLFIVVDDFTFAPDFFIEWNKKQTLRYTKQRFDAIVFHRSLLQLFEMWNEIINIQQSILSIAHHFR